MNQIEIYKTKDGQTQVDVKFEEDTVWLNQYQLAELFLGSRTNIVEHIKNIYNEGELDKEATCRKFRQVQKEGKREVERNIDHYNLDLIISVGYRINSKRGTQFRQWATQRLKDYLVKGYALNQHRLVQLQQVVQLIQQSGNSGELNATEAKYKLPHDQHHPLLCPPSLYQHCIGITFRQIIDYGNYHFTENRCSGCKI